MREATAVRQRLLIVDDDLNIVAGLAALLSDEWDVTTATTTREARATFAGFSPDVVLLDMQLPDGNGGDVLHDLKMLLRGRVGHHDVRRRDH